LQALLRREYSPPEAVAILKSNVTINPHGIHHVTAIVRDPQQNVDFYTKVLRLRLAKQTVNFDAPHIWHL
jgi:hypothetical protein